MCKVHSIRRIPCRFRIITDNGFADCICRLFVFDCMKHFSVWNALDIACHLAVSVYRLRLCHLFINKRGARKLF